MKFEYGQLVFTAGVAECIEYDDSFRDFVGLCWNRYLNCDWGDLCEDDAKQNPDAMENNDDRIFASYKHPVDENLSIWIITEWDRSATTILFPSEY